jgi:hypothetical protein
VDGRSGIGPVGRELGRRRHLQGRLGEGEVREPLDPVEPVVPEGHAVIGHGHGQQPAALRAWIPANLEDVGPVRAELQVHRHARRPIGVVHDA